MSRSDAHRLADMVMAADEIAAITERGKQAYDDDVARAVERCLEILGEAAKAVSPAFRVAHPEVPWDDMARVRDRLSHHDHRTDPEQLWNIATHDLPTVADTLHRIVPPS